MTFFNCWLLLQLTDQPSDGSRQAINFEVNLLYLSCSLLDASRLHSLRLSPRLLVALVLFIAISPLFSALKFIRNRQATQALMLPLPLPPSNPTHGFILYKGGIYIYPMMLWCRFLTRWQRMAANYGDERRFYPIFE